MKLLALLLLVAFIGMVARRRKAEPPVSDWRDYRWRDSEPDFA